MSAVEFDPAKDAANVAKHGISLDRFRDIDLAQALIAPATPTPTEDRWVVVGQIDGKLHTAIVTYRGDATRVISLRRANRKETRLYDDTP